MDWYLGGYMASPVETHGRASWCDGGWMASPSCALKGQHIPAQGNALGVMGITPMPIGGIMLIPKYLGRCPRLGYAALSGLQSPRHGKTHGRASLRAMPIICLNYDLFDLYDAHDFAHAANHVYHINHSNHSSDRKTALPVGGGVPDAPSFIAMTVAGRRGRHPLQRVFNPSLKALKALRSLIQKTIINNP
jgi:hypothetical protein